ncbi:carboxylesterase family protein [Rhodococcus opacus]|uniref:carboxylesterase family protein n=1 Tax=Rhodococcus opacus TaxID=37919 RepID=UPI000FFBE16B|nr:carboxylesterase family protein [Rhodococcus opacus]
MDVTSVSSSSGGGEAVTGSAATGVIRTAPIRYATARRFERPHMTTGPDWGGPSSGQICPQLPGRLSPVMGPNKTDLVQGEDCLNLSIATPGHDADARPVMVFLHGGAFNSGAGLMDWYDGSSLSAEADVVVVSVNYRLGVFGYLCLDGVSGGNLGLYDQVEALRWVKANIAGYGGDPGNVTVFGQSAGAVSIRLLMEIPDACGLFTRAIMQSGPGPDVVRPRELAEDVGRIFAENVGGDPRTASVAALLDAQRKTAAVWAERSGPVGAPPFSPVSGTDPLPVLGASFSENVQDLDVICGWNADDVSAFTGPGPDTVEITHRMLAEPLSEFRDRLVQAGARACTYRFDWRPRGSRYGATHCVELPLLLGTREAWEGSPMLGDTEWGEVELLGETLRRTWGRYAHTGVVEPEPGLPMAWDPAISHSL